MTKQEFNPERTFGIEIEFIRADRERVAELIREKGLECNSERYNHRVSRSAWKVITDSSCGSELVSPILKGREGIRQLKIVTEALKEAGAKVDRRCGLHIHHDVNDYDAKQIANIYAIYIKLEGTIDSLLPRSRRANNNNYCKSLAYRKSESQILEELKKVESVRDISNIWNTRYIKLNIQSYITYGTIEFRQHSGTIEFEKIYNWLLLTQQMVEKGRTNVTKVYKPEYDTLQSMRNVMKLIPAKGADEEIAEMFKWYRGRAAELAA